MLFIVLAAAAFLGGAAQAHRKRDTVWVPSDPQAFELKLGFDQVGRYVLPVGMGKPFAQAGNFSFLLSTSTPYIGVASVGCAACVAQAGNQAQIYDISKSSSAVPQGKNQSLSIGGGIISGGVIRETCVLTKVNGSKWAYDNQSVIMVQNTDGVFGNGAVGLLGLGRSSGNDSFVTGVLQGRGWQKMLFGLAVNAYDNATGGQSAGSLTVRELNPGLYTGEVSWQPVAKLTDVPTNVGTDWALKFESYRMTFGSRNTVSPGGGATVDPYFPEIKIPSNEATDFFGNVPNAVMTNDTTTLSWVVPCDQNFDLTITIGNNTFRIKTDQLIDTTGTVCTSLVKGWADSRIRSYLFGKPFATTAYIAYNALANASSDQIGVAPRSDGTTTTVIHQGVSSRTVVISVVASVVGVAIVAALLYFFIRWRRQRLCTVTPHSDQRVKEQDVIEPFTLPPQPHSATPLIQVTGGEAGSGWIIEQGSIGGEPGTRSSAQYGLSSRMRDNKSPLPSPNLQLVRNSQLTVSSSSSPEANETHPLVSSSRPKSQFAAQYETPDIQEEVAPPPYERSQT